MLAKVLRHDNLTPVMHMRHARSAWQTVTDQLCPRLLCCPPTQAVGAPIGAAMLTHLPPRQVEFAVGCLMLLVILFNWLHKKPSNNQEPQG